MCLPNVDISGPGRVAWKEDDVAPCCGVSVSIGFVSVSVWVLDLLVDPIFDLLIGVGPSPLPR